MDGVTELARTSDDRDDHPYWFWLDDFGEYALQPGYRVVVSTTTGWQAEMVIPALAIDADVTMDTITASGPAGLLFIEVYDGDYGLSLFVPGPDVFLNLSHFGFDLLPSATVVVTYEAPDGNRARVEMRLAEVSEVNFWLKPGTDDWMWGTAKPGSQVSAYKGIELLFTTYADPACGGCWGIENPVEINPGDVIKVATDVDEFGVGDYEVIFTVPTPLTAAVDTSTDIVSGQIGGRITDWVQVYGWWDGGDAETTTDEFGDFSVDYSAMGVDIPSGADGYIHFINWEDYTQVLYHQYFRSLDLVLDINYSHDWIEGQYAPGHEVTLTVYESDKVTPKASATMTTGEIPWWGGGTGFSTNIDDPWIPERPNIQPYDWVVGAIDVDGTIYNAEVQIGLISGEVDITSNSITGTVDDAWLLPGPIEVQCHPWGGPEGTEGKQDMVVPDGIDTYACAWDPATEWDIQPGQDIGVLYRTPEGHFIYSAHQGYSDELIMMIHYDHDWIQGYYKPGHSVYLEVRDGDNNFKASITLDTQFFDDWGWSGFATHREGTVWSPSQPDIQPGDTIHGEVDDGTEFWAQVKIGLVTAEADYLNNRVSGTVDASWLMPGPVEVGCYTWEDNGRNVYTTVVPDGTSEYTCEFTGDNYFDLDQGSNLMVAYFEPDGHELIGDFRAPSPHLRVEKWMEGSGIPGEGGYAEFYIQYANHGESAAENVVITDTMVGFTYLSDTSGVVPTFGVDGYGNQVVTWALGTVIPGDWIGFQVFVSVTEVVYDPILDNKVSNVVVISTSNAYDQGDPGEKFSEWTGEVIANSTDLNVGINPWTWNPAPGQDFIYAVGICNNGDSSSLPVTLTIDLDALIYTTETWMIRSDSEAGWELTYRGDHQLILERPTVSGWHCHELYFLVNLDTGALPGEELYSTALVVTDNETYLADNFAGVTHHVGEPYMDLAIWHNWHGGSLVPGGHYRYGITFRNEGNVGVDGPIEVNATLPAGTTFAGWDSWGWGEVSYVGRVGNVVTWTVSGLKAGYDGTIEVWVNINSGTAPGTTLVHEATIEVQVGEENTDNNYSRMVETVYGHGPNLRVNKRGEWHGNDTDPNAWYEVHVENIGDQTVNDVVITDTFPAGMTLRDGPYVSWDGWTFERISGGFKITLLDQMEPGWNFHIQFTLTQDTPDDIAPGNIYTNTVEITPLLNDVNPDDNEATAILFSGPDMYVEKTLVEGVFLPGEEVTYLLRFGNAQTAWWWGMAGNAILTDTLPEGMSFVSATMHWCEFTEWCPASPTSIDGQTLTWNLYPIGSSDWNEILLTVEIDEAVAKNNPLINHVTIASNQPDVDIDPYTGNNASFYDPDIASTFNLFLPLILR